MSREILSLMAAGHSPGEVMSEHGISRGEYYTAISKLEADGSLSKMGDLPDNASAECWPSEEAVAFFSDAVVSSSWTKQTMGLIQALSIRHGWLVPPISDRYSRVGWTGQAVRRADFEHGDLSFTVIGFLVPRADREPWQRAAPTWRSVHIEGQYDAGAESRHVVHSLTVKRGGVVTADSMRAVVSTPHDGPDIGTKLALAVAWVAEGRAVLTSDLERGRTL